MAGLLTLGALTLSLQAYDQAERIQDMQTMEFYLHYLVQLSSL